MITDIYTVMWKEIKELVVQKPNMRGGWLGLVIFIAVFGIFIPLQSGPEWVTTPLNLVYWAWIPFMLVSSVIADSFAGERERHTLESLLATRLPDRAILFGKVLAAVLYGWGITMASVLLGLVTANLAFGGNGLLIYPPLLGAGILGISFLISTLAATLGVLISLRASTVRNAQQLMGSIALAPMIFFFGIQFLPEEWRVQVFQAVMGANVDQIVVAIVAGLLVVDAVLLVAAMARFQRAKMILD